MKSKERLCWAVAGGVLLGMVLGLCISPLTAQDRNFGEITCSKLQVVDAYGRTMVGIGIDEYGGNVAVMGKDWTPKASMIVDKDGGRVGVWGKDGKSSSGMGINASGGHVGVQGKDAQSTAVMGITKVGGSVVVMGKYGTLRTLD